jgi:hypothetical protein
VAVVPPVLAEVVAVEELVLLPPVLAAGVLEAAEAAGVEVPLLLVVLPLVLELLFEVLLDLVLLVLDVVEFVLLDDEDPVMVKVPVLKVTL